MKFHVAAKAALAVPVLVTLSFAHAAAITVSCGDVIGPDAGEVVIDNDLNCSIGNLEPALTIIGPGTKVDFQYRTLSGALGDTETCLFIEGEGATVENVAVEGCGEAGVVVGGEGEHELKNVYSAFHVGDAFIVSSGGNTIESCIARESDDGFVVSGASNELSDSMALSNTGDGFRLSGATKGKVSKCLSWGNNGNGFRSDAGDHSFVKNVAESNLRGFSEVGGDGRAAKLIKNVSIVNGGEGIYIANSSGAKITGNRVIRNSEEGISLIGHASGKISRNKAYGNFTTDLADELCPIEGDPTANQWSKNSFGTSNLSCLE